MALITSYASLQAAIIEYSARDQDTVYTARVPWFIQSLEAKMNRSLFVRQMEARSTTTTSTLTTEPEFISLPTDFQSMRRIRLSGVTGKPRLDFMSTAQMDEWRYGAGNVSGQPRYFTIFGDEIELAPTPDANYTIEMVYRKNIPALSTPANDPNWLLLAAPDLYLYGALLESAPYIKEDGRIQTWALGLTSALDGLNNLGLTSTFNAGPMRMSVSGMTP